VLVGLSTCFAGAAVAAFDRDVAEGVLHVQVGEWCDDAANRYPYGSPRRWPSTGQCAEVVTVRMAG
jgi:hypothetical protein